METGGSVPHGEDGGWIYVWGVTYFIDGSDEGISVIELFTTRGGAEKFLDQYKGRRPDRTCQVTRFRAWQTYASCITKTAN
jgi:hypothetical protein